jgi:hypothetical protein
MYIYSTNIFSLINGVADFMKILLSIKKFFSYYFTLHPLDNNESYWQHFVQSAIMGLKSIYGGILMILHGLIPGILVTKAGDVILHLADYLRSRRQKTDISACDKSAKHKLQQRSCSLKTYKREHKLHLKY